MSSALAVGSIVTHGECGFKQGIQGLTKDGHVEADSQRPDVSDASVVRLPAAHLRSHEGGCACRSVHQVAHASQLGAAEVRNLDMPVRAQQQVVWLQVTVGYLVGMQIIQPLQNVLIR